MLIWWSSVWQRGLSFSKGYSLNVFHLKQISICFHFLFNFEIRKLQVKFNSSQTPLSWPTSNMTRIVVVSVLYLLFWKLQMILPLKIYYRHTFIPRYHVQYLIESNLTIQSLQTKQESLEENIYTLKRNNGRKRVLLIFWIISVSMSSWWHLWIQLLMWIIQ